MNNYTYDEIYIGLEEAFSEVIDSEKMELFLKLSKDNNPLHVDEIFAMDKGFSGKVVYGMAVASLYSTLVGVYLPGERCLLQNVNTDFMRPVYVGDTLKVTGRVVEKHDTTKRVIIKADIRNQEGVKVSKAKIEVGLI